MATITTISGAQFDAMPYEEGRQWELVNGELISMPSPTWQHQDFVFRILLALRNYLETSKIGGLAGQDVEFALTDNDRVRPDVCVLLGDRARRLDPTTTPIPGAPDVAIEVISPSERATESHDKVRAYLHSGTTEVWQIFPKSRTVQIHRGETARSLEWNQPIETDLLPGLALRLASLFA
ncbi:MAG TPA: Uma2 family endonuclease [Bryobacteraceae bacterium]|jgi:Uma2 family endonuclease|nr:Uma2 family endonuclease [Bryobacteraceae bacterium]